MIKEDNNGYLLNLQKMKTNIKLRLTDFEKDNLKKNKVKIVEILNYSTDELEVLLNSTSERAKEIHALAIGLTLALKTNLD